MIQCCFIVDIDECTVYGPREICPFMTNCINTVGSYICQCMEPGFVGDGKQCVGKEGDGLVGGGMAQSYYTACTEIVEFFLILLVLLFNSFASSKSE